MKLCGNFDNNNTYNILKFNTKYFFRYFIDVLNILQGFFIFVIFVCKRQVIHEISVKFGFKISENNSLPLCSRDSQTVDPQTIE